VGGDGAVETLLFENGVGAVCFQGGGRGGSASGECIDRFRLVLRGSIGAVPALVAGKHTLIEFEACV